MDISRRSFLWTSLAACTPFFAGAAGEAVRIGLLSDIHVGDKKQAEVFRKALEAIAKRNPDAVVIPGDLANNGLIHQLELVAETWRKVFPGDKAPDGRHVEKVFITGNHDVEGHTYLKKGDEDMSVQAIGPRRAEVWEKCFGEKWEPIRIREVKGWKFVCADYGFEDEKNLKPFFAAHHAELASAKAFFYLQHRHPFHTCFGPQAMGQDMGSSQKVLNRYPNAVAISGHSHMSIHDERAIWQGAFTSIGLSTLTSPALFGGRENSKRSKLTEVGDEQMPAIWTKPDGKQGMFMWLYPDRMVIAREEYVYGERLGPDWEIPFDTTPKNRPFSFEAHARSMPVPEFGAKAAVTVKQGVGKNRKAQETPQLFVSFPNVLSSGGGTRAYDYEIQIEAEDADVVKIERTKRVYSAHCYLGEKHDTKDVVCAFGLDETPAKRVFRFAVRPGDAFGRLGSPLYSPWFTRSPEVAKYRRDATCLAADAPVPAQQKSRRF